MVVRDLLAACGISQVKNSFFFALILQGMDAFSQSGLYSNHQDLAPRYSVSTNQRVLIFVSSAYLRPDEPITFWVDMELEILWIIVFCRI